MKKQKINKLFNHISKTKAVAAGLLAITFTVSSPSTLAASHSENIEKQIMTASHAKKHDSDEIVFNILTIIVSATKNSDVDDAIELLDKYWRSEYIPQILETVVYTHNSRSSLKTIELLEKKTGQSFGRDISQWYFWLWNQPLALSADYADFKASLYRNMDPKFETYFQSRQKSVRY